MPEKITNFSQIIGNKNIITFLHSHLQKGTLPNRIIFEGEEGLGKTSIAQLLALGLNCTGDEKPCYQCPNCKKIISEVIENNHNLDCVQVYNMSIDSGKDAAKLVKDNMSATMSTTGKRVIICDEAHAMSDAAQDVFLVDMEYLPKNVYLFFCTTDAHNLKKTLKSRSFTISLQRPKRQELIKLLAETAAKRQLNIQGGSASLALIADWSECKPRKALNLIEGFGFNSAISTATIKEFIDYVEIDEVLPIIESLSGSLITGLSYAQSCKLNSSIIDIFSDILCIKLGGTCYKFSSDDLIKLHRHLNNITSESLITFLRVITSTPTLTRAILVNALISAHSLSSSVEKYNPSVLQDELVQKSEIPVKAPPAGANRVQVPTFDTLLRGASRVNPPTIQSIMEEGNK